MILTDKEIEAIDIGCGMSEIDGTEPFSSYKYEHHLLKAQLKKAHDKIVAMVDDGYFLEDILKALLEETKKHGHRYKTIIIDSRGVRHQRCKCGKHRSIKPKEIKE